MEQAAIKTATIICSVVLSVCFILFAIAIILNVSIAKRVSFAIFENYLLIYLKKETKQAQYVMINYDEIIEYVFEPNIPYASDDTSRLFPHVQNYGDLIITTMKEKFKAQIKDIAVAKEWMSNLLKSSKAFSLK